jgi:hypothetical protein
MRIARISAVVGLLAALVRPALAQDEPVPQVDRTAQSAEAGMLLPGTLSARVGAAPAVVTTLGGYDGARKGAVFSAAADVHLWGPLAVRVGATYLPTTPSERDLQPQVGLRVQLLDQGRHGLDAGAGLLWRRDRYHQDGGELQLVAMASRRMGRLGLYANASYGQDPEGDDRDGVVSAAAQYTAGSRLQLGIDGRLRFDLFSSDGRRDARDEPGFDLTVGPTATWLVGPVAVLAQVGASALKVGELHAGILAMGGIGRAF